MRVFLKRLVCLVCCYVSVQAAVAQDVDASLAAAYKRDQSVREEVVALFRLVNEGHVGLVDSLVDASERMERIDSENIRLVQSLLDKGFPKGLDESSYEAIWIIVDHADVAVQEQYLPVMKKAARKGLISANSLATLCDRIDLYRGRCQKYGTQSYAVVVDGENVCYIWPVKRPRRVDALRRRIGICPMSEYVEILRSTTGGAVVYNPYLTMRDMRRILEANGVVIIDE